MRFDAQASSFDTRAGLPAEVCRAVATAVLELGRLDPGEQLLELGAGTGAIGRELLERWPAYVGLDLSRPMLDEFAERVPPEQRGKLVHGDAASAWPVSSGSVGLVLGSRVLHLLQPGHVAAEALRVRGPRGLVLLVGRVKRQQTSVRARMRRQMRELLTETGVSLGARERAVPELFERLARAGAEELAEWSVARWPRAHSPRAALESWRLHRALGGVVLDATEHERILARLSDWALSTFGNLDDATISEEEYVLTGMRLPPGVRG